ncbi:MAG: hypothetical protein ACRDUA_08750, partial [Micromonosporaceae bacterium]
PTAEAHGNAELPTGHTAARTNAVGRADTDAKLLAGRPAAHTDAGALRTPSPAATHRDTVGRAQELAQN